MIHFGIPLITIIWKLEKILCFERTKRFQIDKSSHFSVNFIRTLIKSDSINGNFKSESIKGFIVRRKTHSLKYTLYAPCELRETHLRATLVLLPLSPLSLSLSFRSTCLVAKRSSVSLATQTHTYIVAGQTTDPSYQRRFSRANYAGKITSRE